MTSTAKSVRPNGGGLRGRTPANLKRFTSWLLTAFSFLLVAGASVSSCGKDSTNDSATGPAVDTLTLTYETAPVPEKMMTNLSRPDTVVFPGDTLLIELSAPEDIPPAFRKRTSFELTSEKHCTVAKKSANSYYVFVSPKAKNYVIINSLVRRPNTVFRFAMKDDYGNVIDYFCERDLSCEVNHAYAIDSSASAGN